MLSTDQEKKWYVIYTRANIELHVSKTLTEKKIINYCPVNNVSISERYSKKKYKTPLLKSYVFVKVFESQLTQIKWLPGVLNYLNNMDKPAVVSEFEIGLLRH